MVKTNWISCQNCGKEYASDFWFVCNRCNYRVCPSCISKHKGKYGIGGFKCSQCAFGSMERPKK